jgi:hypothetical protein
MRLTVVECEGLGLVVEGPPFSVGLVLSDARRLKEPVAWFKRPDAGLVGLDASVCWEVTEVVPGEWSG